MLKKTMLIATLCVLCSCTFNTSEPIPNLILNTIQPLQDLIGDPPNGDNHLEGSGLVYLRDTKEAFVVCDNLYNEVLEFNQNSEEDHYIELENLQDFESYEGITFDNVTKTFYLVSEEISVIGENRNKARILSFTEDFKVLSKANVEFIFVDENKGIEGLTSMYRNGTHYLLGLCEGNNCVGGDEGKEYGGGTILVLQYQQITPEYIDRWNVVDKIHLPSNLPFADYSGIDIYNNTYLAVISQTSSYLWIGELIGDSWEIKDGDSGGQIFQFPRTKDGNIQYCTVEGVAWLYPTEILITSDKTKDDMSEDCDKFAESIGTFGVPWHL